MAHKKTDPNAKAVASTPKHPGHYVRIKALLPNKISVTAAAKLIGVSRPSASNFLNAKVSTTTEMASRIERAFNIPAQTLLDMQAAYDAALSKEKGAPANTKVYVPPFLKIKANDIETWAIANILSRTRLSVFLRILVHSTGVELKKVDFPGNDDAERPGWDGFIEADEGTPWIPEGISGWEFGVTKDIKRKADDDFAKSVKATTNAKRQKMTFVFVTPRRWPGKQSWIEAMKSQGMWQNVRAYDASDLEQWLEQSLAGQTWFANETHHPSEGVRTLDKCWSDWAGVAEPVLVGTLFKSAVDSAKHTILSKLAKAPNGPTVIAADSVEEGLAFLAQLFGETNDELLSYRDRVLIFDETGVFPRLAEGNQDFIAVASNQEVEREFGQFASSIHTIVVYPRNAVNTEPYVTLEPLSYEAFRTGLEEMGCDRDEVAKYSNASGRSLTVLRRQLSTVPAIKTPDWASQEENSSSLTPFLFVGSWNADNEADQAALSLLADDTSYEALEKGCQRLAHLNDAPIWSLGHYRGLVSKVDVLFAIAGSVTKADLERFFQVAKIILSEDDPSLDLPEKERWAAAIHGKTREFSSALRDGISETVVLLAVYGNHLFKSRLGFDAEAKSAQLVRELLTPLTTRTLEANDRDLPTYAEAAPEEFLAIIKSDLISDSPEVFGLLRPADTGFFGGNCPRTGLLWALEGLAWSPDTFMQSVLVLGHLSTVEITDNWSNKPIQSLECIFRAWMPQTAASHDLRVSAIKKLAEKFPEISWKTCLAQFESGHSVGDYSHKPRWRADGYGYGEPFKTHEPRIAFIREMIDMALAWSSPYTAEMLCNLIECLPNLLDEHQAKVWSLIRVWVADGVSDSDMAKVRETIRTRVMSRRRGKASKGKNAARMTKEAKAVYQSLEPTDLLNKHEWLFKESWVEDSADELYDDGTNFEKREERITKLRTEALREILRDNGFDGILHLAEMGKASWRIGWILGTELLSKSEITTNIIQALSTDAKAISWARKNLIAGALRSLTDEARSVVLGELAATLSKSDMVQLLLNAPFCRCTWEVVEGLSKPFAVEYWKEIIPEWIFDEKHNENNEAVEHLLAIQRPRAAFSAVHFKLEDINPPLLHRMLSEMAMNDNDQPEQYQLQQYDIERAFSLLDKNSNATLDEKAGLEFAYIDILSRGSGSRSNYGVPNLEKYIEAHPEFFVRAVVWAYKRRHGGEDPEDWKVPKDQVQHLAERGHRLLDALERVPGRDKSGELDADKLSAWVKTIRSKCSELDRAASGDICLGKLFSSSPKGSDGVWPCEPVRQVLEEIQSEKISEGASTGLYNARGVHWRGEGGGQERELADKYRGWANILQYSHPFVASTLLKEMMKTYEREADQQDVDAGIRQRMNN